MFGRRNRSLLKSRSSRTRRLLSELLEDRRLLAANPLTSIPLLNSYPEANASLYLDFDGHYEETWGAYSNVSTPAYDTDGAPTSFSDDELVAIEQIWQVVSEDFAPFNINVTTVEPSVLAAGMPAAAADGVALRIAIGGVPDGGNGGLAYINAFTNYIPNVAYVRGSSSPTATGSVASHEAGHSFGLEHVPLREPLDTSWQRLMNGIQFSDVAVWSLAPTSVDTSVTQDDISILAGVTNGFGLRNDDHSDTAAEATPLTQIDSTWIGSGQVGTNTDVDAFAFTVSTTSTYSIRSMAAAIGPNLDAVIELYNSSNELIATDDPQDTQHAEVRLSLDPGDYYVAIRSTGDYGWIGQYDVVIETLTGGIKVTPSSATMTTGEDGQQTTFTVVLESQPTSDVTVPVSSNDNGLGTVSPSQLVFNATNWAVPQVVAVTGVDNFSFGEDVAYGVTIAAAVSDDPAFDSTDPADLSIVNVDNDASGFLYQVSGTTDQIVRSGLSGSPVQTIVDIPAVFGSATSYSPRNISVDNVEGKIYWIDAATRSIYRASLDGSNSETVISFSSGSLFGLAVDPDARKMYWGDSLTSSSKIFRANLDGSQVEVVVADTSPGTIALDIAAGKLYWTDSAADSIRRANLDGSAIETLWSGGFGASTLALEPTAGKMYWSTSGAGAVIYRSNLDGTDVEAVVDTARYSEESSIRGITVDAASGKLYWVDLSTKSLYRSDLNGTLVAQLGDADAVYGMGLTVVHPAPPPVTVFSDSFEAGDWSGQWVEDSQNDWFRSSQRASDGSFAAEVDGRASNATLTMVQTMDLSGYDSATLTFSWFIESGFDRREYIALDIYDGVWHQNVHALQGNVDQENVWHHETVDLSGYLSNAVKIRFRANVSSSSEDANVDNVQVVARQTAPGALLGSPEMASAMMLDSIAPASTGGMDADGGGRDASLEIRKQAGTMENTPQLDAASVFAAESKTNRGLRHTHALAVDAVVNERGIGFLSDELLGLLSDRRR